MLSQRVRHLDILKMLPLSPVGYLVTGGAWLAVMEIRDNDDVDIIISDDSRRKCELWKETLPMDDQKLVKDSIDWSKKHSRKIAALAGSSVESLIANNFVYIDDYKFVPFSLYHKYKKPRKREQDRKDLKKIRQFFGSGKHNDPVYKELFTHDLKYIRSII